MRYKIFPVFLLFLSLNCFGEPDFAGVYNCKGFDPYINKVYSGKIQIAHYNTVYNVAMQYDTGEKSIGTAGIWDNETIAVVFQNTHDPKIAGLERYSYSKDHKKIQGYWVYLGKDKLGKEVCEKE
ncbi:MAG: hypothetical protein K0R24_1102 [Gammaproteobacteria bacterium]|jgi:hypothetical protein|nr:hypothetical protein [Gammaproteobacteria bacterium]